MSDRARGLFVVGALLGAMIWAVTGAASSDQVSVVLSRSTAEELQAALGVALATITTNAPTTITTAPTTTEPPTTTTTIPPTTTLPPPPVIWPPQSGPRYDAIVRVDGEGLLWRAPYFRTLTSGAGWADGNRDGYDCLYGILLDAAGNPIGRFLFKRVDAAAAYVKILDEGMPENGPTNRHYDTGLLTPAPVRQGECKPLHQDVPYTPLAGSGELPVVDYLTDGTLLERRSYLDVDSDHVGGRLLFQVESASLERVVVVAYWDSLPVVAVYYEAMADTVMAVSVP